jgi:hypothetical protein
MRTCVRRKSIPSGNGLGFLLRPHGHTIASKRLIAQVSGGGRADTGGDGSARLASAADGIYPVLQMQ